LEKRVALSVEQAGIRQEVERFDERKKFPELILVLNRNSRRDFGPPPWNTLRTYENVNVILRS
jgi:hypothetical protein